MVYVIESAELTGYNGETATKNLEHLAVKFRTVTSNPNLPLPESVKLADQWLDTFNDLEKRLHESQPKLDQLLGLKHYIHWVKIKFNYKSYFS